MAAIKAKPVEASARKWAERAGAASGEYADQAIAAATHWQERAGAAGKNYKDAVTQGNVESRFTQGVQRAGSGKYAKGIRDKGSSRYAAGVDASQAEFSAGVGPYLSGLNGFDPGTRGLRGSPGNYDISKKVGEHLKSIRLQRQGAGR